MNSVKLIFAAFFLSSVVEAQQSGPYIVNCKAKLWRSDVGTVAVNELPPVQENDTYILRRTQIADIQFELQEYKRVFFYRPVMRFPNGQEISTTGYFDATGMIRVDSTREVSAGVKEVADIRCCRSCSFSDWGL